MEFREFCSSRRLKEGDPKMTRRLVRMQSSGQITWRRWRSQSGRWIAVCDAFALTMEGDTEDDLRLNILEGMREMLADLHESGELEQFLRCRGWRVETIQPSPTQPVDFEIPLEIIDLNNRDSARSIC